ncbi:MAG: hypothetical protein WCI57_02770 [Candidatus Berkelbacteria bacterium]
MKKNHFSLIVSVITLLVFVVTVVVFADNFSFQIRTAKLFDVNQDLLVGCASLLMGACILLIVNFVLRLISISRFKSETVTQYKVGMVKYFKNHFRTHGSYFESDWSLPKSPCFKLSRYIAVAIVIAPIVLVSLLGVFYFDFAIYSVLSILFIIFFTLLIYFVWDKVLVYRYRKIGVKPIKFEIVDDGIILLPKRKLIKFRDVESITFKNFDHFGLATDCVYSSFGIDLKTGGKVYSFTKTESVMNPLLLTYLRDYLANLGFEEGARATGSEAAHISILKYL